MTFRNWLAGLVMGVCGGFLALIFPPMGVLMIGLGAIGTFRARPRLAGASGLLVGSGAIILALMVQALMACRAFDAAPNQDCEAPDITAYLVLAGALSVAGVLGSLLTMHRRSSE